MALNLLVFVRNQEVETIHFLAFAVTLIAAMVSFMRPSRRSAGLHVGLGQA